MMGEDVRPATQQRVPACSMYPGLFDTSRRRTRAPYVRMATWFVMRIWAYHGMPKPAAERTGNTDSEIQNLGSF